MRSRFGRAASTTSRPWRATSGDVPPRLRRPPVRSRNRSSSSAAISEAVIDTTRAAASSIANGIPSRRRQISTTAAAFDASRVKIARAASRPFDEQASPRRCRRDVGRRSRRGTGATAAATRARPSTAEAFAARGRGSARRDIPAGPARRDALAGSSRCSQLSRTNSSSLGRRYSLMLSANDIPGRCDTPSAAATTWPVVSSSVGDRELAQPRTVRNRGQHLRRDLHRQPGLADPPSARQGHQAPLIQRLRERPPAPRSRPTNDVNCNGRFAGNASSERNGGNSPADPDARTCEHPLGSAEVAEAMLAQVDEVDRPVGHQPARDRRHHDLAAVRDRHQPRRTIHRRAVVVAVTQLGCTRVHTHPHPQRTRRRPTTRPPTPTGPPPPRRPHRRAVANAAWKPSPVVFTT